MRRFLLPAIALATLGGAAFAQTSVDIRTGRNGQLSGSASAGGMSSSVREGYPQDQRGPVRRGAHSEARCTGNGRTVTVTSPDGSSSSSVSTSGDGVSSVGGSGSTGSTVRYGDCDDAGDRDDRSPATGYRTTSGHGGYSVSSTSVSSSGYHHRKPHRHHRHVTRHA